MKETNEITVCRGCVEEWSEELTRLANSHSENFENLRDISDFLDNILEEMKPKVTLRETGEF